MRVVNLQRRRLFFLPVLAGAAALIAKPAAAVPAPAASSIASEVAVMGFHGGTARLPWDVGVITAVSRITGVTRP
jgi:hypothetical protein